MVELSNVLPDPVQPNRPPVANAGSDQTITLPTNSTTLDGSGSRDADGYIASYSWAKISGPSVLFNNVNTQTLQLHNLVAGNYVFELKVSDAGGLFSKDSVIITVISARLACDNSNRPHLNARLIPIGTLSHPRLGMAVAAAGNKIVFAGAKLSAIPGSPNPAYGSAKVDIYDIVTQTWSTAELSENRSDIAAIAAGNKIFFAGGRLGDGAFDLLYSNVDIYDVSSNTWSVASLSEPRAFIAAAAVGNKVLFAGGEKDGNYNTSAKVDIYDLSTKRWSTYFLSEARAHISAVTIGSKVYFAGGQKEDRWYADPSNRIDIYDDATNSWSSANLSRPMGSLAGVAVTNKIYWADHCDVEIKDVSTWNSAPANLFASETTFDEIRNAVSKDGKVLFFRSYGLNALKFDIYDTATNTWSIGLLPQSIGWASIISVNNTIYIAGGVVNGDYSNLSNQVWRLEF